MVRVSVENLSEQQLRELDDQLVQAFTDCSGKQVGDLLLILLGREERIMLAKRYAAILLLQKGHSIRQVGRSLDMGIATASRIRADLETGRYRPLVTVFEESKLDLDTVLSGLEKVLRLGGALPMYGDSLSSVTKGNPSRPGKQK